MNVSTGDFAVLVHPKFNENVGRICRVLKRIPVTEHNAELGPCWFCIFTENVKTSAGYYNFAGIPDWRLRRLLGPKLPEPLSEPVLEPSLNV